MEGADESTELWRHPNLLFFVWIQLFCLCLIREKHIYLLDQIQTSETRGQPTSDTSPHKVKAHSHYCVFLVRLWETVAFLQGDRKFPISALTQPTAENVDCCV